jgi:hypothetical protein
MSSSENITCKGTLRQVFFGLRPLPLLGFCLGWSSNFVASELGQTQSVKLLIVSNRTHWARGGPGPGPPGGRAGGRRWLGGATPGAREGKGGG